jgi:hypothetical protein
VTKPVYGDFDEQFRPRPALWRLGVVSFGQFALALWMANALVAAAEMGLLWYLAAPSRWVFHATCWSTLPRLSAPPDALTAAVAFGFVLVAALVLALWPTRNTLARRLFVSVFAQSLAVFGATAFALRHASLLGIAVALAALWLCARAELRAVGVLASVVDLTRLLPRLTHWLVRIVPAMAALSAVPIRRNWWLAGGLTVVTLMMNASRRPTRFEVVEEPELREAAVTMALLALAILGASLWMAPRKVAFAKGRRVSIERFVAHER